jgi:predicted transcriptional regulator
VGYRGKVQEQEEARGLRATGMTMPDIAEQLGVSRSSVSLWTREVVIPASLVGRRQLGPRRNRLHDAKVAEIERLQAEGVEHIGRLSEREFLVAGAALYAGEGTKAGNKICFANSDPRMIAFFCAWLRRFVDIDESRLRMRIYLHQGLDLEAAQKHWSSITGVPVEQFGKPYRAVADASIRVTKHVHGCAYLTYTSATSHRVVMGLVDALLSSSAIPG